MNILLVTATYAPFFEVGGPPVKVRALAHGLAARGHSVTVLTADHHRRGGEHVQWEQGVEAVYLPVVFRRRWVPVVRGARRFADQRLADIDVVHIFGLYDPLGVSIARAAARAGVPYAVEPMGMSKAIVRSRLKKRLFHLFFGTTLLRRARSIVATSDLERDEILAGGIDADKVVVRANGVDLDQFHPAPDRGAFRTEHGIGEGPITMFVGRLTKKKHPEMALDAFIGAGAHGALVYVGPDEDGYGESLAASARRSGVQDRVHIVGPVMGPSALVQAYADADVFILPSENENFGNAVAEAMACGVAVVISDRCGIAATVEAAGAGRVVGLEVDQLATALRDLLGDDAARARCADAGRRAALDMSWDHPLDQTEEMYRSLGEMS